MSRDSYVIDAPAFAREGRKLSGREPVGRFERIAAAVLDPSGEVGFEVTGEQDEHGARFLEVATNATLSLRCERCLEALSWPVETRGRLLLVPPGRPLPDEDEEIGEEIGKKADFDAIHAGSDFDLLPLIEDEVLLALPYAPRHESCEPPQPLEGADKEESPFAVLSQLRTGKGKSN